MTQTMLSTAGSAHVATYARYPFEIVKGEGMMVYDAAGHAYLDFYGGHAVVCLGHSPEPIRAALAAQAGELLFYSNVAPIPVRERAARALVAYAGAPFAQVFFCNSGTEANEAALKVAIRQTGRTKLAALTGAFHGRTLLALAATHGTSLHQGVETLLPPCVRLSPNRTEDLSKLDRSVAAVIVEPIQSMAGVVTLDVAYLEALRTCTRELGILLVFDEIQTGIGRLGDSFAARRYGVTPDMITVAKGIAAGVPAGAVLFSDQVAARVKEGDLGSTFGGGPLACAALLVTLDEIERQQLHRRVREVSAHARTMLRTGPVRGVRGDGWLMGLETAPPAREVQQALLGQGILTGASADPHVLRLLPPLIVEERHVDVLRVALESL